VAELPAAPNRALQFRSGRSPLHRVGAGWKLLAATAIAALAIGLDALPLLFGLAVLVASGYAWARLSPLDLWRDLRWLLVQGAIAFGLTLLVRGGGAWVAGLRTALQLLLVFLPVALVLRTTSSEGLLDTLRRWMPERIGFALGAALRLVPVFARELGEMVEMQRLRGARLGPRDLGRPGAWRDWLACVALPMTVRAIELAQEAADAATLRGIGAAAPGAATPAEDDT
jgi:energy-coupling factor transporter transmembrane protein EcfT